MTTDTKAVKLWDLTAVGENTDAMLEVHDGDYVLFTDHERVVGELREAFELAMTNLGARNKEVNQLNDALAASRAEVKRQSKVIESYRNQKKILDAAMEKGNV